LTRSKPFRLVCVIAAFAAAAAIVVVVVKAANGAFSGQYTLTRTFTKAGEGLHAGSEVVYRGVQVGRVTSISLSDRRAKVGLGIDGDFSVPSDAQATIEPINVFGADEVSFSFPHGDKAPRLQSGQAISHTRVSDELGDLFAAADPLLQQIDAPDLSSVVSDLAQASVGEGPTIAGSIDEGAKLAQLLDQTLPAQLSALDSFTGFVGALAPTASSLNAISQASNTALPAFNNAAPQYAQLLRTLAPFAEDLAQFLSAYHPDIETLLASGDNVARVLLVRQQDIGNLIQGLGLYVEKFAKAIDPNEVLPDGSHYGYFQTFVFFGDVNQLICSLIAPAVPGLSALAPLQQALTGAGTPLNCSTQITAFDAAQSKPGSAVASPTQNTAQASRQLSTQAYQALTAPQSPTANGTLGGLIDALLGGGSSSSSSSSSSNGGLGSLLGGG